MNTSRRKILIIASAYPRFDGDVITPWLGEMIARLRAAGVDAEVLAPAYLGGPDQVVSGVRVHRFRYAPRRWEMLSHDHPIPVQMSEKPLRLALVPGYLIACAVAATRLARSGNFDVIHALWPLPHALPGMIARRLSGVPMVSTFFSVELHWLARRHAMGRLAARAIVRESEAVTAISEFAARELRAVAPRARPTIIPFGAAVGPGGNANHPPFSGRTVTFLFVGRLGIRKGVDVLLRAMSRLPESTRLLVIGEGAERSRLTALATELGLAALVTFTGHVTGEELEGHLSHCDALVLPAVTDAVAGTEGLGVVLIEAMSHGRPVIASDIGGIPDVVLHGRTGLLVAPGDDVALAVAMNRLIGDPALAGSLGAEGKLRAESHFGWAGIVTSLIDVYNAVSNGQRI